MTTNSDMIGLWNSPASASWATHPERYDTMLQGLGERLLQMAGLTGGERVLDVGCGTGQLSVLAAEQVGRTGQVLGVDVAVDLLTVAASRGAHLPQLAFAKGDAQVHPFAPGSFDVVLSRFGVMFFADAVAAFANLLAATTPGGRLAFVAWQSAPLNEWVTIPLGAVVPHVGFPELPAPGAPGPFAFADLPALQVLLADAGWAGVQVEDVKTTVSVGGARTANEAVDFITEDTFGQMLLGKADPASRSAALSALHDAYAERITEGDLRLKAAAWLVTAHRPPQP